MKKNFSSKAASAEFGSETNVQEVAKQNQQAEKNKLQSSGQFGLSSAGLYGQQEEFGSETDFNEVKKQNQQAEQGKQQSSGRFTKQNQQNNF